MPYVQPEITCNLQWRHTTRQMVFAKQGDFNSRKVSLLLYNGSNRFTWADNAYTAEFAYKRSDGRGRAYSQIDGNSAITLNAAAGAVTVLLEPEVLAVAGMVECELRLLTEGSRIATFTFGYFVEKTVVDDSTPSPSPGPEPTPAGAKTKFFGFDSMADYESFIAENPTTLGEGDIVVITSTSGGNTLHTFYVLITGNNGLELDSRHVITVGSGGGSVPSGGWSTSDIADGAITTAKLAASAVTAAKIGSGAVTETKLGTGAVTSGKIGSGAVTEAKIADKAVTKAKLSQAVQDVIDNAVLTSKFKPQALGIGLALSTTAGGTIPKTASLGEYELKPNGLLAVHFTTPVEAGATLSILTDGASTYTAAKPIYWRGQAIADGVISYNDTALFVYDGTNFELLCVNKDEKNYGTANEGLPIVVGADGKSAVGAWQGGGSAPLIVTIASDGHGGYTTDTSETVIVAAASAGRVIWANTPYGRVYYGNDDDGASFYGLTGPSSTRSIPRFNIDGTTVTYSTFVVPSSGGSGVSWASAPTAQQAGYVLVANNDGTASWVSVTNWQTGGSY